MTDWTHTSRLRAGMIEPQIPQIFMGAAGSQSLPGTRLGTSRIAAELFFESCQLIFNLLIAG